MLSQALSQMQLSRSSHPRIVGPVLLPECRVVFDLVEALLEFRQAVHQRLGNVLATELAESLGENRWVGVANIQSLNLIGQSDLSSIRDNAIDMGEISTGLLSDVQSLDDANFACRGISTSSTDLRTVLLDALCPSSGSGLGYCCYDLTSNYNTVRKLGDAEEVITRANSEAHGGWNVARVLLYSGEQG